MNRRQVIVGSGAALATVVASGAHADRSASGNYEVTLGVGPGKESEEFLCRVALKSAESGLIHQTESSFKRGTAGTLRTGEGRSDGSTVDLLVEVRVDESGAGAEFVATISDRGKVISIQRTTFELGKA